MDATKSDSQTSFAGDGGGLPMPIHTICNSNQSNNNGLFAIKYLSAYAKAEIMEGGERERERGEWGK